MTTSAEAGSPAIKGSWEAQLEEAERLAANFNDAALPIFAKLFDRLSQLPKAQRMAANQRLQNIFLQTAVDYQSHLSLHEKYSEAVAVIDRFCPETPVNERPMWKMHAVNLLIQAGRGDEAAARMQEPELLADLDELEAMGNLAMVLMRTQKLDEAAATLQKMGERVQASDVNEEARRRDLAYVQDLTSILALERGDFDEAEAAFAKAVALDPHLQESLNRLYTRFIRTGRPERALPLIKRDKSEPMRAGFWHGLALYKLGEADAAEREWRKVAAMDLGKAENPRLLEYILAIYYLGDPAERGLSTVLGIMQEEKNVAWSLYLLAALGWALRDHTANVRANLHTARNHRRANGLGGLLPRESWYFFADLLADAQLAEIAEFFEQAEAEAENIVSLGDSLSTEDDARGEAGA